MSRWPGGIIRQTPAAPSGGTASGVWSMADAAYYKKLNLWPTLPGAPTGATATAGASSASVAFTAPTNTGIPTVTSYRVTSSPGAITATGASSPITVSGLTNGTSYTFTVAAINAAGTGPESASSNAVTPIEPNLMVAIETNAYPYLYVSDMAIASDGSFYLVGYISSSGNIPLVAKYNSDGTLAYQKSLTITGVNYPEPPLCEIDASNNLYLIVPNNDDQRSYIVKINSSGTIQWTYYVGGGPTGATKLVGTTLYVSTRGTAFNAAHVFSFNVSTTSVNWSTSLGSSSQPNQLGLYGLDVTSNYIFVGGNVNQGGATTNAVIGRLSLSGGVDWLRIISGSGRVSGGSVVADSSDNFFISISDTNSPFIGIYKLDANYGSLARATISGRSDQPILTQSATGDIYAITPNSLITKLNSSLSQQFARTLTGVSLSGRQILLSGTKMYMSYTWSASDYAMFMAKYPSDGTGTGSVSFNSQTLVYASSATTWTVSGSVSTTGGPSTASASLSAASGSSSFTNTSYTSQYTTF